MTTGATEILRTIARGVELGHTGNLHIIRRGDMMTMAREYCDANGLSYARKDLWAGDALAGIEEEAKA